MHENRSFFFPSKKESFSAASYYFYCFGEFCPIIFIVDVEGKGGVLLSVNHISVPEWENIMSESLYDRLGGEAAVNAAVDLFYKKVLADDRISGMFEGIDMASQHEKQKKFLTFAFGGPNNYTDRAMRGAHKKLVEEKGLNDSHFDAVMENLGATLTELGVPGDLIGEAAAIAESTRTDVLNK